jgi:hypothetical protein
LTTYRTKVIVFRTIGVFWVSKDEEFYVYFKNTV